MSGISTPISRSKTLVLCLDGTTNHFGVHNTNVVRFFGMLKKDVAEEQVCYYQPGIGTFFDPGTVSPYLDIAAKILDSAIACYVDQHIMNAYRFIMDNYTPGDKITIFGFSRGAYTARALAGMVHKIGLLPKNNGEHLPFAYQLYALEDPVNVELARGFKKTFCMDIQIDFVGVWDTVASVGLLYSRTLPFTNSNKSIKVFRHALALDERRARFKPNLFHVKQQKTDTSDFISVLKNRLFFNLNPFDRLVAPPDTSSDDDEEESELPDTDVREVWFVGAHEDVGGGADLNFVKGRLCNIALRWMVEEVIQSNCGIVFQKDALRDIGLVEDPLVKVVHEYPGVTAGSKSSEKDAEKMSNIDKKDAIRPIHDSLKMLPLSAFWWLLEALPTTFKWQDGEGNWHTKIASNLGGGRLIVEQSPKFHVSVKERMEKLNYRTDANVEHEPVFVG